MVEKDLEIRITKIEEQLRCYEKLKDEKQKDYYIKKLEDVTQEIKSLKEEINTGKGEIKTEILAQNDKSRNITKLFAFGNLGVVSVVFASRIEGFTITTLEAWFFLIAGALMFFYSWAKVW
ncbi:MAG: hypothetical protein ABR954_02880 [Dehalococcoidales bacterium]